MTLRSTKALVQATSILKNLVHGDLNYYGLHVCYLCLSLAFSSLGADVGNEPHDYPELEALSRLDFGAAMNIFLAKRLTFDYTQVVTADVEANSVIIGERNRAATEALEKAINNGHNKTAILYDEGHMPDLGRRLKDEFDLVPCRVQWVTTWSIKNRNLTSQSLPFMKKLAEVSGWPLNRYQTLALLIFSFVLAMDLWFWELFFGTTVIFITQVASDDALQFVDYSNLS